MSARNNLVTTPPYAVEQGLKRPGADLCTARLRRKLTLRHMAAKIGTGIRAVTDAEKGKPSTGIAVYAGLLWALDLLGQLDDVAAPDKDDKGQATAPVSLLRRPIKTCTAIVPACRLPWRCILRKDSHDKARHARLIR